MANLNDYIQFNSDFRDSVNLYLDLNKTEKINSYIPTKSSVDILDKFLTSILNNQQQSSMLIGPYGKGKSHLLLLLLSIISMNRHDAKNKKLIGNLAERIKSVNDDTAKKINKVWEKGKFLPVLIMSTQGDLNQAFLIGLNEALKRENLIELTPQTYYTYALSTIHRWKNDYPETYFKFKELLTAYSFNIEDIETGLEFCESDKLDIFKKFYPELTSGSTFNPLVNSEVLPMYDKIAVKLKEDYSYSGIYIIFDEFSKYIEGQEKKTAGNNMKLLQDMCELANASKTSQVFITMVAHKSIKEYGKFLSTDTINSFTGIEGRMKEILFVTSSKNNFELIQNAIYKTNVEKLLDEPKAARYLNEEVSDAFYKLVAFSSNFTKEDFDNIVLKGCYPLSPTTAYLLLNVSEKVAQNERTLFTFISKEEQYSVSKYVNQVSETNRADWIVNADLIYDYFKSLFKKDVMNEFVHNEWLNAEYALSKVTEKNKKKILKTLAIIDIVNKPEELMADDTGLRLASGVPNANEMIEALVAQGLIYKKGSNNCYVFKTRATSELKFEIRKRRELKGNRINIGQVLLDISEDKYILPKRYNDQYKMTRYLRIEYMDVKDFLSLSNIGVIADEGEFCDGKFIILFNSEAGDYSKEIKKQIKQSQCEKIAVVNSNAEFSLENQAQDYSVLQELKKDTLFFATEGNEVLEEEVPVLEDDLQREIKNFISRNYGYKSDRMIFYLHEGKVKEVQHCRLSEIADSICNDIYSASIVVNNELINKEFVTTSPIKKARKTIIEKLLQNESTDVFMTGTSAEATIYRALFVGTGIRDNTQNQKTQAILDYFNTFITEAGDQKKCLDQLIQNLTQPPIGMRRGVIPLYLANALSLRKEDLVIYFDAKEEPIDADIILNMCESPEDYYLFVSLEDVKKEQYISNLSQLFSVNVTGKRKESRITEVVLAMQRWFRALPQVTKNVKRKNTYWDGNESLAKGAGRFKDLMQMVETNPYEILFFQLPIIFGTDDNYNALYDQIQLLKRKLNGYYDWISARTAKETIAIFDKRGKNNLRHTLLEWYEKQSDVAKKGLHDDNITEFMSCIENLKEFDDETVVKKIVKAATNIYLDSWNDNSLDEYIETLKNIKESIENIGDASTNEGKSELTFVGKNGEEIKRFYEPVSEGTGSILRNILSDTLEDFSDLSVNDKVAILLEMIEKTLN